jgi:hypothetical protein
MPSALTVQSHDGTQIASWRSGTGQHLLLMIGERVAEWMRS